ncbi:hypothetical protein RIF29_04322 [Crotalaria pallida]|uniref:Uncharacterized protein n=1 Tax=Crotalaria pallida TaxID=3830 RepID=A0AAN9J128_CROPI
MVQGFSLPHGGFCHRCRLSISKKKRGRPPKNSTPSTSKHVESLSKIVTDAQPFNLTKLDDDDDLADIDGLTPKQAEAWLKNIDILREKIAEKASGSTPKEDPVVKDSEK